MEDGAHSVTTVQDRRPGVARMRRTIEEPTYALRAWTEGVDSTLQGRDSTQAYRKPMLQRVDRMRRHRRHADDHRIVERRCAEPQRPPVNRARQLDHGNVGTHHLVIPYRTGTYHAMALYPLSRLPPAGRKEQPGIVTRSASCTLPVRKTMTCRQCPRRTDQTGGATLKLPRFVANQQAHAFRTSSILAAQTEFIERRLAKRSEGAATPPLLWMQARHGGRTALRGRKRGARASDDQDDS